MKKFTINVHFDMVVTEEVAANDLQEARRLAELKAQDRDLNKESECYGVDSCLVEETDIKNIEHANIFRIFEDEKGQKIIKVLGYFYQNDEGWRHVEFGGYEMPLKKYLENKDKWDEWESEAKQYVTEMTEEEAMEAFIEYNAVNVNHDSPILFRLTEGNYY